MGARRRWLVGAVLGALLIAPAASRAGSKHAIVVFAAVPLSEAFRELGLKFEKLTRVHVTFSFAASSLLAMQVQQGAPVDVLATADEATMARVSDLVETPTPFARNRLEIAVEKGNPKHVAKLADLARRDLTVVLAAEEGVRIARDEREALAEAGVSVTPRSLEPDERAVLNKVMLGEADAGIVAATDVKAAAGKVDGVEIPDSQNVVDTYPIAVVKKSADEESAKAFATFVLSPQGREILARFGFAVPSSSARLAPGRGGGHQG